MKTKLQILAERLPDSIKATPPPPSVDPTGKRLWLYVTAAATPSEVEAARRALDEVQSLPEPEAPVDPRDAELAELRKRLAALEAAK